MGMRLTGKIPSGHFCASFGLSDQSKKDNATSMCLAFDGWFIKRYSIELESYYGELHDHVKEAVDRELPLSYDPETLAR